MLKPFVPGKNSPADLNALVGNVNQNAARLAELSRVLRNETPHLEHGFYGEITDRTGSAGTYEFKELFRAANGVWGDVVNGRGTVDSADLAVEFNECPAILPGRVVWIWEDFDDGYNLRFAFDGGIPAGQVFPVLVWRYGGTTDGDDTTQCDRTYKARTIDATGPSAGGYMLDNDLTPQKRRPATGTLSCPPATGAGVPGLGYMDGVTFRLYDANETLAVDVCD